MGTVRSPLRTFAFTSGGAPPDVAVRECMLADIEGGGVNVTAVADSDAAEAEDYLCPTRSHIPGEQHACDRRVFPSSMARY